MRPPPPAYTFVTLGLLFSLNVGCVFRPSFDEAREELSALIDPAAQAAFGQLNERPNPIIEEDPCSDPLRALGDGLRPVLRYEVPLASDIDPRGIVGAVEEVWRDMGLEIESDDNQRVLVRYSGRDGYSLRIMVNFANQEAYLGGSGPCVDNPNT